MHVARSRTSASTATTSSAPNGTRSPNVRRAEEPPGRALVDRLGDVLGEVHRRARLLQPRERLARLDHLVVRRASTSGRSRSSCATSALLGAGERAVEVVRQTFDDHRRRLVCLLTSCCSPRDAASFLRSTSRARCRRDFTVPSGRPVISQISSIDRSSTSRSTTTIALIFVERRRSPPAAASPSARPRARGRARAARGAPIGGRSRRCDGLVELVAIAVVAAREVLDPVLAVIDGDPIEPGRELRLLAERLDRLEHRDEHFLRDVLGLGAVAEHPIT